FDKHRILYSPLVLWYAVKEFLHAEYEPETQVSRVFRDPVSVENGCYFSKGLVVITLECFDLEGFFQNSSYCIKIIAERDDHDLDLSISSFLPYTAFMLESRSRLYFVAR